MNAIQLTMLKAMVKNEKEYSDADVGSMIRANWNTPSKSGVGDDLEQIVKIKEIVETA